MLTEKKKHRTRFYKFDMWSKRVTVRDYTLMCLLEKPQIRVQRNYLPKDIFTPSNIIE